MPLPTLEDFGVADAQDPGLSTQMPLPVSDTAAHDAAYEQGYSAGWDDATGAGSEEQARIGASFARALQDMTFTYHDARAQVIDQLEPLLRAMITDLLPGLAEPALVAQILKQIQPLAESAADMPLELVSTAHDQALIREALGAACPAIDPSKWDSGLSGSAYFFDDYQADNKPSDVSSATRAVADLCLLLFNSNEFVFVY